MTGFARGWTGIVVMLVAVTGASTDGDDRSSRGGAGQPVDGGQALEPAIEFLSQSVPRWRDENGCFACHHHGDGMRALAEAHRSGATVERAALHEGLAWLSRPSTWDTNRGDPRFADEQLATLQFSAARRAARTAGLLDSPPDASLARQLVSWQRSDGSWKPDHVPPVGTPIVYSQALATWQARQILRPFQQRDIQQAVARANDYLAALDPRNVPDAAVVVWSHAEGAPIPATTVSTAMSVLERGQGRDGGWGPYITAPPEVFDTSLAVIALSHHRRLNGSDERLDRSIRAGSRYLAETQGPDGSWPETTRPTGSTSYAHRVSTTSWAVIALCAVERAFPDE